MAILKMQRISIYALSRYSKEILETLQRIGVMEIEKCETADSVFYHTDSTPYSTSFYRSAAVMSQAGGILTEYTKEKKGLLSSLEGRTPLSVDEYEKIAATNPEVIALAYKIIGYKKKITENKAKIIAYEAKISSLLSWEKLDVPLDTSNTSSTKSIAGSFPEELSEEDIKFKIAEISPDTERYEVEIVSADSNQTGVFVAPEHV